ncbi:helix-turn-helix domain-containing protein [Mesorhizobium sp. M0139]|uniref:helix-turn-helix domain-containing protein n=1 Tax=Mesorhizobium sp. M0139 TaxID=2956892 RepID=UPI0033381B59
MSGAARKIELGTISERTSWQALFEYACELEGMVKTLTEATTENVLHLLQRAFHLTGKEAKMLASLADGRTHTKAHILDAMYWDQIDDAPEPKIIDVFVCKVRKKIAGSGVGIDTLWGNGYVLTGVETLRAIMSGAVPVLAEGATAEQIVGRHPGTFGRRYGTVRDAVIGFLQERADQDGVVVVTSREVSAGAGLNGAGSVNIRNLERAGRLKVLKAAERQGAIGCGLWTLKLAEAA